MPPWVNSIRKDVEIGYEPGDYEGEVQVIAFGSDDRPHNTEFGPNDGLRSLSYPHDFHGDSDIEVKAGPDGFGVTIDSGPITVP